MNELDRPATLGIIHGLLYEGLFGAVVKAGPEVQRTTMNALMELRAGKWSAVFLFGVLTQIALVATHLGKTRASVLAVTLFSIGMTTSALK